MSLTGIFNSHLIMAILVEKFGTDEQKQRFLPRFAKGELRGGLALTEPDCGTDLQAIRTRAVRQRRAYVVNGTKTWISNGIQASVLRAAGARPTPRPSRAHKGMSMFVWPRRGRASARRASSRSSATRASIPPSWCSTTSACRPPT